jgi:glycosyltransferase involved in cell wall biosynthesis
MTARPLVSIVTPTLNQGRFIDATIRSIRGQTYDHVEHIVVDGGSTDQTLDILRTHEGSYPMRWSSEPDRGMYDAVNKGMRQASGEILAYLNSDDLYFPWTIEIVVAYFDRHPETDFVFGDALSIDDETARQELYWTPPFDLGYLREVGFLAQPTVFWRRSAYVCEGEFDDSLRYVADCEYWMRAGAHHRFAKINEFLAVERNHAGAQRLATDGAVWDELDAVRARFRSTKRGRAVGVPAWLRRAFWNRVYPLALLFSSWRGARRGPWANLRNSGTLEISPMRLLVRTLPRIGARLAGDVVRPSRRWLEPPAT